MKNGEPVVRIGFAVATGRHACLGRGLIFNSGQATVERNLDSVEATIK